MLERSVARGRDVHDSRFGRIRIKGSQRSRTGVDNKKGIQRSEKGIQVVGLRAAVIPE